MGAASVQYGPRLLGFAADLKHRLGVPYRKCAAALGTLCGLTIAPSALVRSGHRLRRLARPSYEGLIAAARSRAAIDFSSCVRLVTWAWPRA